MIWKRRRKGIVRAGSALVGLTLLGFFRKIIGSRLALLSLVAVLVWQLWMISRPKRPRLDSPRRKVATQACWQAGKGLPSPKKEHAKIAVFRLGGDSSGFVTEQLREVVDRLGYYELMDPSFFKKLLRELNVEEQPVTTFDKALTLGKRMGVPYALFGNIGTFASDETSAHIRLELRLVNVSEEKAVHSDVVEIQPSVVRTRIWAVPVLWRILGWILFAALFPLAVMPVTRRIIAKESNMTNLLMLLSYTLITFAAALALTGFYIRAVWTIIFLLAALFLSGFYNLWVANQVERFS
jgi:hypothetical protein